MLKITQTKKKMLLGISQAIENHKALDELVKAEVEKKKAAAPINTMQLVNTKNHGKAPSSSSSDGNSSSENTDSESEDNQAIDNIGWGVTYRPKAVVKQKELDFESII